MQIYDDKCRPLTETVGFLFKSCHNVSQDNCYNTVGLVEIHMSVWYNQNKPWFFQGHSRKQVVLMLSHRDERLVSTEPCRSYKLLGWHAGSWHVWKSHTCSETQLTGLPIPTRRCHMYVQKKYQKRQCSSRRLVHMLSHPQILLKICYLVKYSRNYFVFLT